MVKETHVTLSLPKGMKQTELGLIPQDWNVVSLGEVLLKNPDYGINAAAVKFKYSLPTYLRITDIDESGRFIKDNLSSVENINSASYYLREGDIVFARTGASVGKTYLYNSADGDLVFAGFLIRIQLDSKLTNSKFLFYNTQTKMYKDWIVSNSMRSGQPGINSNEIKTIKIPLPPLAEQEAIATALSDCDAWIESLEAVIAKKRLIKQGAMQELLTPKEDWEVKKLGEVGEIITGGTPSTLVAEYWNGDTPWITPTDINIKKDIYNGERNLTVSGVNQIRKLRKNSLLVTCIASIGKNAILRVDGACNQQINAITPNALFSVDYLYYLLELNKKILIGKAGTTATLMLSKAEFSLIEFLFPSFNEQTRIATVLSDMDTELEALGQKLNKARQIKQGMMQELLTGRVRLVS